MSGPLRVGLVCPYDLDVPGGVREQVLGLAGTLLRSGHDVSVLAPRARGAPSRQVMAGVTVHSAGPALPLPSNGSTARLGVGVRARARAAAWTDGGPGGAFDVVHVHEPIPPGIGHTVLRRLAAARDRTGEQGPAVVATVHVSMSPRPAGRSRSLRTASRHVGSVLRDVDVLTAVSEHARRTLVDHLGRVPLVVPNGVDVAGWASAVPRRAGDGPVVLVLGRADEPRKGVDVLLRAWPRVRQQVPRARLVVVGPAR
ncbi:glycosyltransferase family 4 protein, partial [Aquipuribacter sp. MA13-6]